MSLRFIFILFVLVVSTLAIADVEYPPPIDILNDSSGNKIFANTACTIDIHTQTASPQPVFIRPGTSSFFHPANRQGQIQLSTNQEIELWCSGPWTSPTGAPNLITATCVSGLIFRYNNVNFNFNQFQCRAWPQWTTRRTSTRCFSNGMIVDVGFQIGNRWLHVFKSCHDLVIEQNWYTYYQLTPVSAANQRNVFRPRFNQSDFFPERNVDNLYSRLEQRRTIAAILEDQAAADQWIEPPNSDIFLARGHMAAMTDFILASEQQATFLFINTAPQWQAFNAGNWVSVEISSRRLAADRNIVLDVYTGTFGITHLWNTAGSRRNIFLDWPAGRIPVPKIFYKILIDIVDRAGVVLIGEYLNASIVKALGLKSKLSFQV